MSHTASQIHVGGVILVAAQTERAWAIANRSPFPYSRSQSNYLDCIFQFTYKKIMHHALAATNWMTLACPLLTRASTCRAQPLRAARFSLSKLSCPYC